MCEPLAMFGTQFYMDIAIKIVPPKTVEIIRNFRDIIAVICVHFK